MTQSGRLGVSPDRCRAGDDIVRLIGGKATFLRRREGHGRYELIGETYVHGRTKSDGLQDGHSICLEGVTPGRNASAFNLIGPS